VRGGAAIDFDMFGKAIAEFEFTLVFADEPIDQFARGRKNALTTDQKQGALLFLGQARCVECHAVSESSNEMFSDFRQHVIDARLKIAEHRTQSDERSESEGPVPWSLLGMAPS
jgi:cytochrome c peroxidase